MYRGGAFAFSFTINNNYPHEPPKVKCTQTVRVSDVIRSQRADRHLDISSQRRFRGQRLLEHSPGRLEASVESDLGDGRTAVSIPGAKRG